MARPKATLKASIHAGGAVHLYYWGVPSPHLRQRSPRATHPVSGCKAPCHLTLAHVGNPDTGIASNEQSVLFYRIVILKSLFRLYSLFAVFLPFWWFYISITQNSTGLGQNVQLAKRRVPPRVRTAAQHWWAANTLIYGI